VRNPSISTTVPLNRASSAAKATNTFRASTGCPHEINGNKANENHARTKIYIVAIVARSGGTELRMTRMNQGIGLSPMVSVVSENEPWYNPSREAGL
jgi:hypothetical protein